MRRARATLAAAPGEFATEDAEQQRRLEEALEQARAAQREDEQR